MANRTDFSLVATLATLLVASACSSEDSDPLRCGPGTVKSGAQCILEDASTGGSGGGSGGGTAGGGAGGTAGSTGGGGGSGGVSTDASTDADASTSSGPPSCAAQTPGADKSCGNPARDCCSSLLVPGGTFNRDNNVNAPATVSPFYLDEFEVTVGRFRQFVEAYAASKPNVGDGANPHIPGSGWDAAWEKNLPADKAALLQQLKAPAIPLYTWTDAPSIHERRPMSHVTWWVEFAFCAWDGGRLPTNAEWGFAACGGGEQRAYPWGSGFDLSYVAMGFEVTLDSGPNDVASAILEVGSRPKGMAKWGHHDMAGSMAESLLDTWDAAYAVPCNDCAAILWAPGGEGKGVRGGAFGDDAVAGAASASNSKWAGGGFWSGIGKGFRCARQGN